MQKKYDISGILLALTVGAALLAALLVRALLPRIILPRLDAVSLTALSLVALLAKFYLQKDVRPDYRFLPLYAALVFGLFPLLTFFVSPLAALRAAVLGAVLFTACAFLMESAVLRLASAPAASKLAPLASALLLFLAAQALL